MSGLAAVRSAALAGLIRPASELGTAASGSGAGAGATGEALAGTDRMLPVLPELRPLLPGRGLRRGATVAVLPTAGAPARAVGADPAASGPAAPGPAGGTARREAAGSATARSGAAESAAERAVAGQAVAGQAVAGQAVAGQAVVGTAVAGRAREGPADADRAAPATRSTRSSAGRRTRPAADPLPAAPGGASSLLLALLAEASRTGSWCAVVGVPTLGAVAAAEYGIALDRLALIPNPGPEWATVVAALIDGLDVVAVAVPSTVAPSIVARLAARARQRGAVLVPVGQWAGADVTLQVVQAVWEGLGQGRGRLRRRAVTICARGRGAAARPKQIRLWLPRTTNGFAPVPPVAPVAPVAAPAAAEGDVAALAVVATTPDQPPAGGFTALAVLPAAPDDARALDADGSAPGGAPGSTLGGAPGSALGTALGGAPGTASPRGRAALALLPLDGAG